MCITFPRFILRLNTVFNDFFFSLQVTYNKIYRNCVKLCSEYSFLDITERHQANRKKQNKKKKPIENMQIE